jgi:hypothetical protein
MPPWNHQTPSMARTPSSGNSPRCGVIEKGLPQLPFVGKILRALIGGNVVVDEIHQQPRYKNNESRDDENSWGQFIDTAEAESEIIRHSKILSRRYSMQ